MVLTRAQVDNLSKEELKEELLKFTMVFTMTLTRNQVDNLSREELKEELLKFSDITNNLNGLWIIDSRALSKNTIN